MIGYLDLPSGLSGDMMLGCLLDAGWPLAELRRTLVKLNLPAGSWAVSSKDVMKGALRATLASVTVAEFDAAPPPLSPLSPMLADHGPHRGLEDVRKIINRADVSQSMKTRAIGVFTHLARAEAKVHGTTIERIHFHEVGALDAIVDIVGVCAGIEALGIEKLYASAVPAGTGWVNCAHGRIPLPAPATLEMLAAAGAVLRDAPGPGELLTPTGAAILAEFATFSQPAMTLDRIGIGAGQRDCAWPNVARLLLGEPAAGSSADGAASRSTHVLIETNIDDMNPQLYEAVSRSLFAAGALDVWQSAIVMKKSRPAITLSVLAPSALESLIASIVLAETTTLGVRVRDVRRHEAQRQMQSVPTRYGDVTVKVKLIDGRAIGATPEYDECVKRASEAGVAVRLVIEAAQASAHRLLLSGESVAI